MRPLPPDNPITKLLIEEYDKAGDRLVDFMLVDDRLLATGVALIAAAASVSIGSGKTYFLVAIPTALAGLFCVVEYLHAETLALGGYKAALEKAIEHRVGIPIKAWERHIAPTRHGAWTAVSARAIFVIVYVASICAALVEASATTTHKHWGSHHSTLIIVLTTASVIVGAVAAASARWFVMHEYARVRTLAEDTLVQRWTADLPPHGSQSP